MAALVSWSPFFWRSARHQPADDAAQLAAGDVGDDDLPAYVPAFASTHCAYPRRDGQAELTWVAWLHTTTVYRERSPISVLTWLGVE